MDGSPDAVARAAGGFAARFGGGAPVAVRAAPGRVNLIGDHTDYCEGFVLPAALALRCACAIGEGDGGMHEVVAADFGEVASWPCDVVGPEALGDVPRWARYVAGVMDEWHRVHGAVERRACRMVVASDVPPGGGLASSAALEVAVAGALDAWRGVVTGPVERALLCQRAEHRYAGVPCGIMDQLIACTAGAGEAKLMDCRSLEVEAVPLPAPEVARFVLVDTGVRHRNEGGAYAARREACARAARGLGVRTLRDADAALVAARGGRLDEAARRAAVHVVGENGRVLAFAAALRAGDVVTAGRLMLESHASLSEGYRVSCAEADALVARLRGEEEVLGCRMTGAGFGGWVVVLVGKTGVGTRESGIGGVGQQGSGITGRGGASPGDWVDGWLTRNASPHCRVPSPDSRLPS